MHLTGPPFESLVKVIIIIFIIKVTIMLNKVIITIIFFIKVTIMLNIVKGGEKR